MSERGNEEELSERVGCLLALVLFGLGCLLGAGGQLVRDTGGVIGDVASLIGFALLAGSGWLLRELAGEFISDRMAARFAAILIVVLMVGGAYLIAADLLSLPSPFGDVDGAGVLVGALAMALAAGIWVGRRLTSSDDN